MQALVRLELLPSPTGRLQRYYIKNQHIAPLSLQRRNGLGPIVVQDTLVNGKLKLRSICTNMITSVP
jgi:hypothetical protein